VRTSCVAIAVAVAFPFSSGALAQSSTSGIEAPTRNLGVVTVTGVRPTSLPTQIPTTMEGVTRDEIEQTINATDSEDALKYFPSLLVRKRYIGDYNHAVLSSRASGTGNSARSAVYADGILLSNYLGNGATYTPRWGLVAPEEIERVDVMYGPFSAAYPGNSVGAVVDYITRMPTRLEAHAKATYFTQPSFDLYNTSDSYSGHQLSASVGDRVGDFSWWAHVSRTDSHGQPLTFATKTVGSGTVGSTGTPVTGAVLDQDRSRNPWYVLGTATEYTTVQDQAKVKLAYDFSRTLRASYTLGWWHNTSQGRPTTYLRDAAGNPVYSGVVNIDGRSYTLGATSFNTSNEDLTHLMHGLSLKSHTRGEWDWEIAASLYDYQQDTLRAATAALPGALSGGAGRIVNMKGTGWNTLAFKGTWRPQGVQGAHVVDFGLQRDSYQLRSIENATANWINGSAGARNQAFNGDAQLLGLWAQDTWKISPRWKAVLGARVERWSARNGQTANATTTVDHGSRDESLCLAQGRHRLPGQRPLGAQGLHGPRGAHAHGERAVPGRHQRQRHLDQQRSQLAARKIMDHRVDGRARPGQWLAAPHRLLREHERRAVLANQRDRHAQRQQRAERGQDPHTRAGGGLPGGRCARARAGAGQQLDLDGFQDHPERQVPGQRGQMAAAHPRVAGHRSGDMAT
jgi:iron complex outermembrane receptor protein